MTLNSEQRPEARRRSGLVSGVLLGLVLAALLAVPLVYGFSQQHPDAQAQVSASCDGDCSACSECATCPAATAKGPEVKADKCIGCEKCVRIAPHTFAMNPKTKKAYVKDADGDPPASILKAAKRCPTRAIVVP